MTRSYWIIAACMSLAACGDCVPDTPVTAVAPIVAPSVPATPSVAAPQLPVCDASTFTNCTPPDGMELCDVTTYIPCANPTWVPKQPKPDPVVVCAQRDGCDRPTRVRDVTTDTRPTNTCVRNTEPLVLIDGVLVDNCGNRYGTTK